MSEQEERVPCHETIKVLKQKTIYKQARWWCAVVKGELYGKVKTFLYLWISEDNGNSWKRKQKFTVPSLNDWNTLDKTVREYLSQ